MTAARRRPAMDDVARAAGVSHQTVSRVLNSPERVAPPTRQRVQQAIDDLGYRPNLGARALVTRRSGLLGVIVDRGGHLGPDQTSAAVQRAARSKGYATVVAALGEPASGELPQVLELFLDHRVEGVVVIAPHEQLVAGLSSWARSVPRVLVADGAPAEAGSCSVSVNQYRAGRIATEHLLALGHRDIVHVRGPQGWFDADQRELGWRDALREAGLPQPDVVRGGWGAESGANAARLLLAAGLPDAVVCANDLVALGLLGELARAGVDVPGALSVVGNDDVAGAAWFRPGLTTIRQPLDRLGEACVDALLRMIDGGHPTGLRIDPELVVRGSTVAHARHPR